MAYLSYHFRAVSRRDPFGFDFCMCLPVLPCDSSLLLVYPCVGSMTAPRRLSEFTPTWGRHQERIVLIWLQENVRLRSWPTLRVLDQSTSGKNPGTSHRADCMSCHPLCQRI